MHWLQTTGLRILLAFGLSTALWLFVTYTQNPDQRTSYDAVPVVIEGVGENLVVVDTDGLRRTTDPVVALTIDAPQEMLRDIRQSDFKVFVDLRDRGPGEQVLPVKVVTTRAGLDLARFTPLPENVPIRLDDNITRTVNLNVDVLGDVPFSFVKEDPVVTSHGQPITTVDVSGPSNRVERVAGVRASADIAGRTANYNSPRPLEAVTDGGQVVDGVTIGPSQVDVLVPIRSNLGIKRVPLVPSITGAPSSGYVVTGVNLDPQFVTLTGSSGPLDAVESVRTRTIDASGINQTTTYRVEIEPPNDALIDASESNVVTVTLQVAPVARNFTITLPAQIQATDFPSGDTVSMDRSLVQLTLSGPSSALAKLDPAGLVGVVSLRDLPPGTYSAEPVFQLPEGVAIVGATPKVTVTLRAPEPTATPGESSPSPEPTTETSETPTPVITTRAPEPTPPEPSPTP